MSCRDTIHLICWYLEGRLSPAVEAEIQNHLLKCDDCRIVQEAATTTLDREFGAYKVPEHLRPATQAA
jgi:predicted anti-sigma-YlaC factor YlaD